MVTVSGEIEFENLRIINGEFICFLNVESYTIIVMVSGGIEFENLRIINGEFIRFLNVESYTIILNASVTLGGQRSSNSCLSSFARSLL